MDLLKIENELKKTSFANIQKKVQQGTKYSTSSMNNILNTALKINKKIMNPIDSLNISNTYKKALP